MEVAFIRPPSASFYNKAHIREDHQITYALGYSDYNNFHVSTVVYDFTLQPELHSSELIENHYDCYIISVRETGSWVHYGIRLANFLLNSGKRVIIYGQVGRLRKHPIAEYVDLIETDEEKLFFTINSDLTRKLDLSRNEFLPKPYYQNLNIPEESMQRFKVALESTRGCQFKCNFCYINYRSSEVDVWSMWSPDRILSSISVYYKLGFREYIFMDSEFFGVGEGFHKNRIELLENIKSNYPDINFMVYCRADTIHRFDQFELLKNAGLSTVLIGVESFDDLELKTMKKGQRGMSIEKTLTDIIDHDVSVTLSFITFSRNTTVESLERNVSALRRLHDHPKSHNLGMPNFVFNIEASWDEAPKNAEPLPDYTYVPWLLFYKEQLIGITTVVDVSLAPLMEICRVMLYEVATQVSTMNIQAFDKKHNFELWYANIGRFYVACMDRYINMYKSNNNDDLELVKEMANDFFYSIEYFNQKTRGPENSKSIIADEVLKSYQEGINYLSHGWDQHIPITAEHYTRLTR